MRIALLSYEYPPETGFGGIGTYTWHHARALAQLGHEVHVLAGSLVEGQINTQTGDGVHVHRYKATGPLLRGMETSLNRLRYWWTKQRLSNAWTMAEAFRKLQRQHAFDIVEAPECGAEAALLTAMTKVPVVIRLHSPSELIMPYYDVPEGDIRWCSRIEKQAIRRATAISACSEFVEKATRQQIGFTAPATVISNGLDLDWFDQSTPEDPNPFVKEGLPENQPVVLFVGRLENRKGIHTVAEIAEMLLTRHKVSLVLVGQDLFKHYRNDILPRLQDKTLRGSIHWLGHRSISEIRSLVRHCHVFLLPSLWENCPYSCLEAMAASRTVVCSNQGGLPEIIRHGENGLLAETGNAGDFVEKIVALIDNPQLADRLGQAARKTIEQNYTHVHIARQSIDLFKHIQTSTN